MAGVLFEAAGVFLVTLETGAIALHAWLQLVVGVRILMHGVAGQTGDLPALKAAAVGQRAKLASGNAGLAVRPVTALHQFTFLLVSGELESGAVVNHARRAPFQVPAGTEAQAVEIPVVLFGAVSDGVALPAGIGGFAMIEAAGIDDGGVGIAVEMLGVAAERCGVGADVLLARTVTGFAGDAELGDASVIHMGLGVLARLASGGVAIEAVVVPDLLEMGRPRFEQEDIIARHPALFREQVGERQAELHVAVSAWQPVGLHVMGPGQHAHAAFGPGRVFLHRRLRSFAAFERHRFQ